MDGRKSTGRTVSVSSFSIIKKKDMFLVVYMSQWKYVWLFSLIIIIIINTQLSLLGFNKMANFLCSDLTDDDEETRITLQWSTSYAWNFRHGVQCEQEEADTVFRAVHHQRGGSVTSG